MKKNNILNVNSSLSMWLKYVKKLNIKNNYFGLENCIFIAKKMDLLNLCAFVFIIGGTNGKGTTCFILERIFLSSGYRVGLYTSPHLFKYCERIRINGKYLSDIEHTHAFSEIERFRKKVSLSYFDFITLSALILFKRRKLDIIILEVGLGGRLDATNIVNADISVITNIGIDHITHLGFTRSNIGYEKAHIAKKNKYIIVGEKEIPDSFLQVIKIKEAILKKINLDWWITYEKDHWNYLSDGINLHHLPYPKVSLENVSTALTALFHSPFNVNENVIIDSIKYITLPGRFQILSNDPKVILDVAHNPHAVLHLSQKIKKMKGIGKVYAIMGVLKDKDISGMILNLESLVDYWYFIPISRDIGMISMSQLINILPKKFNFLENFKLAWYAINLKVKKEDIILIFGSFYLVSEAIRVINLNV